MSAAIQFIQRSGLLVLHIPGKAVTSDFAAIPDKMGEKLGMPGTPPLSGIVVDLHDSSDFNEFAWKTLTSNLSKIPGRNKFFVVSVPKGMQALISGGGFGAEILGSLDEVFTKLGTKRAAAPKAAAEPKTSDDLALEKLMLKAFQDSALKTLEIQCSTPFRVGQPYLKAAGPKIIHDIAASMGMMSKTVSGSVALGFKEATFLKIMGRMLGEEYTGITSEVEDGCGELLNIIFGQAKKELSDGGHQFGKTLPTIFVGQSLRVRQLTPNPAFVIPFDSDIGQMVIELGYRRT